MGLLSQRVRTFYGSCHILPNRFQKSLHQQHVRFTTLSLMFESGVYLYLVLIGTTLNISLPLLTSFPWRVISMLWILVCHCFSVSYPCVWALSIRMILKHSQLRLSANLSLFALSLPLWIQIQHFLLLHLNLWLLSLSLLHGLPPLCPPKSFFSQVCAFSLLPGSLYFSPLLFPALVVSSTHTYHFSSH